MKASDNRGGLKFKEMLGLLNSFLCFIRNEKFEPDITVSMVLGRYNNYKLDLTKKISQMCSIIHEIPIKNILSFYEQTENKYFEYGVFNMKLDFCVKIEGEEEKSIFNDLFEALKASNDSMPSIEDIR